MYWINKNILFNINSIFKKLIAIRCLGVNNKSGLKSFCKQILFVKIKVYDLWVHYDLKLFN